VFVAHRAHWGQNSDIAGGEFHDGIAPTPRVWELVILVVCFEKIFKVRNEPHFSSGAACCRSVGRRSGDEEEEPYWNLLCWCQRGRV